MQIDAASLYEPNAPILLKIRKDIAELYPIFFSYNALISFLICIV